MTTTEESENLAAAEPDVTSFEATVTGIDDRSVRLDRTYFYPEGGGQPSDRGTLGGVDVTDVQSHKGETVHTLATDPGFDVGETVTGQVDEAFRTYSMRAHTASHVVFGVGRTLFEDPEYGGFDIGEESVRVDFATTDDVGSVNALTFQRRANEVVWESRDVDWYEMDAAEARADEEIVFNLDGDAAGASTVRIVEIEDWDVAACGGTHVSNTIEIGPIQVLDVSNPGADLLRVEYAVGTGAIDNWIEERRSARRAASTLDTSVAELPQRAEGLRTENESLAAQVDDLGERLLEARLDAGGGAIEQIDGAEWYVGTVPVVGPNTVADHLGDRADLPGDVVVLAGRDGTTFVVVGTTGDRDASAVVDTITDEFGGGGGGSPTVAQGGGIEAAPEAVVEFLRDR